MPVNHDVHQAWIALRTALLADAELVALLADAESIYFGQPRTQIALPAVIIERGPTNPVKGDTFTGAWRPDLTFEVIAEGPTAGFEIAGYLEQAWNIPVARADPVASDSLRIDELRPASGAIDMGEVQLRENGQAAYLVVCPWRAKIVTTATP